MRFLNYDCIAYSPHDEYDDAGPPQNCQMHHQTKRSVHEGRNLRNGILLTKIPL